MSAIGDLMATLGMNIAPLKAAAGEAISTFQNVSSQAESSTSGISGALASLGGVGGVAMFAGAIAGVGALATATYKCVAMAQDAAKEQKKLGVILESTGAAAVVSTADINKLGDQLMATTNFTKDMAVSAASALAPFSSHMSGDMFQGVLKAAADVSSVMGGEMSGRARDLGMAMQNPIKGMATLRQLGVFFNAEQKEQLQNYVDQGNAAEAQAMILSAVNAKFAGDAEAMASPMTMLKNRIMEAGVSFGDYLLPYVKLGVNSIAEAGQAAMDFGSAVWEYIAPAREAFGDIVDTVWEFIQLIAGDAVSAGNGFGESFINIFKQVGDFNNEAMQACSFAFRNFSALAQIDLIEIVEIALKNFPSMEGPIQSTAAFFIGTWAGVKAFFGAVIDNFIAGFKELWNVAKAVGAGIAEAFAQLKSGNFAEIGAAFGDGFMKEFTSQVSQESKNPFKEFGNAYQDAADQFNASVDKKGGLGGYLADQKKQLQDQIAANESAFQAKKLEAKFKEQSIDAIKPDRIEDPWGGKKDKAEKEKKDDLGGIFEAGTAEAYKEIMRLTGQDSDADKNAEETAANTKRMVDLMERQQQSGDITEYDDLLVG